MNGPTHRRILRARSQIAIRVLRISHGELDQVIPVKSYHKATEFLQQNKCNFESHVLAHDEHNISPETITLLQKFIKKIL